MEYSFEDRCKSIVEACLQEQGTDPIQIFQKIADLDFIRIHGPEHHVLDGAALLTAYANAGGKIDLEKSLAEMVKRGAQMPGAICGQWGVCGAVSSIGAALSIIDGTGPLTTDDSWGKHMLFTSEALAALAKVGGPRCCKRDAFLAFEAAIAFVNQHYDVELAQRPTACKYSSKNQQCIGSKCPFSKAALG